MADLPITCRGMACPWQCDAHGHMNVMWHTDMFDQARREERHGTVVTVQCDTACGRAVRARPLAMPEEHGKDG